MRSIYIVRLRLIIWTSFAEQSLITIKKSSRFIIPLLHDKIIAGYLRDWRWKHSEILVEIVLFMHNIVKNMFSTRKAF